MSGGKVLDQVIHEHDLEAQTRDRLAGSRAGDDAASDGRLPVSHGAGVASDLKPELCPVLLHHAAHLPAPRYCEDGGVGHQADLPVRVLAQQPDREVDRRQRRLPHTRRHRDSEEAALTVFYVVHGLSQAAGKVLQVRPTPIRLIRLHGRFEGVLGLGVVRVVLVRDAGMGLSRAPRKGAPRLTVQPLPVTEQRAHLGLQLLGRHLPRSLRLSRALSHPRAPPQ